MKTLLDIENSVTSVNPADTENLNKLDNIILGSLPFEKQSLRAFKNELDTGFMKGYDDKYKRIDYNAILNARKKMAGRIVPSFASYNVEAEGECIVEHNVSGLNNLQYAKLLTKIKHYTWATMGGLLALTLISSAVTFIGSIIMGFKGHLTDPAAWIVCSMFAGIFSFVITMAILLNEPKTKVIMKHLYKGSLPQEIRNLIRHNRGNFNRILIVEEAYCWEINEEVIATLRDPDPLVIGERDNIYFLIAKFDVTPLENLIAMEYTA